MKRIISLLLAIIAVVLLGFVLPVGADDNSADPSVTVTAESTTEPVTTPVPLADAPALKSLTNGNDGLILKWGQVDYAQYYRVYRKGPGDTGWVCIAETPDCTYTDKDAKSGNTYKYTVRPVNASGYGGYVKKGISTIRLDSPDGLKATNNKGNVKFQWNAVAGATGYRVYRRAPGIKGWTYIKTVKVCQYVDQNVKNNSKYRYTVKAICSGVHSGYYNEGALIKYLDAPVTQKIVTYPDRLVFEWGSVKGATTYRVYKRGAGESWGLLATVSGTSYTDKNVKKEAKYRYTVKAVSEGYLSGYDNDGVLLKYMGVNGQTVYGKNANYTRPGTINNPTIIKIDKNDWYLTVVNSGYRIPSDYKPDLVYVCGSGERLDRKVAAQYEKMYKAAAKEGVYLTPCSGYRSYDLQKRNYNRKVDYYKSLGYSSAQAKVKAATIIMPPGSSEHNLGYAMDIVCVEEYFEDSKQFKWLQKNAADYGFILRYPKDKQNITKVTYEPWHWRYVGVEAAQAMKSSGLCLEEYMGVNK